MDFIDWIFGIEEVNEFEGSGHFMDMPCIGESFNLKATISLFLSLSLVILWYFTRYWLVSNILAICVACAIVKIFRFNAFYPAFLILLGFLLFDIFWVIIGPSLFSGHSVIHEVLSHIDFPLKIVMPGLTPFVP
jgi:presenilin-like A22 family membrane protease